MSEGASVRYNGKKRLLLQELLVNKQDFLQVFQVSEIGG